VADGSVTIARWLGGYGRLVEVKHKGGLTSRYGHLSGFGPGVKQGRRVRQGQTVGYVGATGDATGPHLHFEIRKGGKPVNPLKVIPPRADPVPRKYRAEFDRVKAALIAELRRAAQPPVDSLATADGDSSG
jgi:murein DD-endopeptidase MepM/ murein hydrolase activator NlpD